MICKNCGQKIDDGSKFCHICGTKLDSDDLLDIKSSKVKNTRIPIGIGVGASVVIILCIFGYFYTKGFFDKQSDIKDDSLQSQNITSTEMITEDMTENIIEDDTEEALEEEPKVYYLLKQITSNERGANETETLEYDFDKKEVTVGLMFKGELIHPEFEIPYYEQDITWFFYPKTLVPCINNYKFSYEGELLGEEKTEYDMNDNLTGITIYDYEFTQGETYNCSVDSESETNYEIKDKGGKVYLTYDWDGYLQNINNGDPDNYNTNFVYDDEGRLIEINGITEGEFTFTEKYEYDEGVCYRYLSDGSEIDTTYYYDQNGVCYKKLCGNGEVVTTYDYIEVVVEDDEIKYKDYEPIGVEEDTELEEDVSSSDYTKLLDDYYRVLTEISNNDTTEVDDFSEKYSIYGDGFMYEDPLGEVGYAYKDLNGDGIDELFIHDNCTITSIYTIKNGKIINLLNGWSRCSLNLCDDNTIFCQGSGGAAYSEHITFFLNDSGDQMKVKEAYIMDGTSVDDGTYESNEWNEDDFWFYSTDNDGDTSNDVNVTASEGMSYIEEKSNSIIELDYTLFRNYK
ncbi:MAG: zinc ribbon domain-containing protein [Eubacterium sp.]|nr:zinc ribbon domain-containing protein [Eubacterium sp.]